MYFHELWEQLPMSACRLHRRKYFTLANSSLKTQFHCDFYPNLGRYGLYKGFPKYSKKCLLVLGSRKSCTLSRGAHMSGTIFTIFTAFWNIWTFIMDYPKLKAVFPGKNRTPNVDTYCALVPDGFVPIPSSLGIFQRVTPIVAHRAADALGHQSICGHLLLYQTLTGNWGPIQQVGMKQFIKDVAWFWCHAVPRSQTSGVFEETKLCLPQTSVQFVIPSQVITCVTHHTATEYRSDALTKSYLCLY